MKKLIAISVVFALIAGAAFAQTAGGISVNAWGRGVFAPLMNVGAAKAGGETVEGAESSNQAGAGVTWGGSLPRTDFRVNGDAEFVGFQIQLGEDPDHGIGIMDNAYIWAKPFSNDILKLYVGKFDVDNLRGKVGTDTGFENFVLSPMDEDKIFFRFRSAGGDPNGFGASSGFMLSSAPTDGLFIGLRVNGNLFRGWGGDGSGHKLLDAYRFMQAGVGYDIADVGLIRAQWIGGWFGKVTADKLKDQGNKFEVGPLGYEDWAIDPDTGGPFDWVTPGNGAKLNQARIEAAFALTAIQNLTVDLGFKFRLPVSFEDDSKTTDGISVGLGARFRADAFQIVAQIDSTFGKYSRVDADDKSADGLSLAVNLIPTYDLDAFTLGASIGLQIGGKAKDGKGDAIDETNTMRVGFGAFAQKGLGSGSVRAGVAYKLPQSTGGKANGSGVFSIPIILEYAFF